MTRADPRRETSAMAGTHDPNPDELYREFAAENARWHARIQEHVRRLDEISKQLRAELERSASGGHQTRSSPT
jgi:hypothetical protein